MRARMPHVYPGGAMSVHETEPAPRRRRALTAESVRVHPAPAVKRIETRDGLVPGLYLAVSPTGAKSWIVRYRFMGRPTKFTIGKYPLITLATAREAARSALLSVQQGVD